MKYLKRDENTIKYHEFEQFKGRQLQLEDMLEWVTHSITDISDFIFEENKKPEWYNEGAKSFSVSLTTMSGNQKFTVVEGDYISTLNNFTVIRQNEFEKEYMPSKYHLLREELFKELERYNETIKYLKGRREIIKATKRKEDAKELEYIERQLGHVSGVKDLLKTSIQNVRIINLE